MNIRDLNLFTVGAYALGSSGKILEPSPEEVSPTIYTSNYNYVMLNCYPNVYIVTSLTNVIRASNQEKICGVGT